MELQEYCFTTEYIKRDQNRVTDALSRLGFGNDEEQFTQEDNIKSPASLFSPQGSSPKVCMLSDCWTTNTLKDFQMRDLMLSASSSHVSGDTSKQLSLDHPEQLQLQRLLREKLMLSKDGILHRTSSQGHSQIVVAIALIPEVLRLAHDNAFSGHQGVKKTLTRTLDRFRWSTVNRDVMDYTKSCHTCGERMPPHQGARAPLKERPIAAKPFERVEIYIRGPLSRTNNGL